jgi:hypothetical protein
LNIIFKAIGFSLSELILADLKALFIFGKCLFGLVYSHMQPAFAAES